MRQTKIFESVYARIDVLDIDKDNETFIKIGSIFMLGEASKYVKSIDDFTIKNKHLVAAIGIDAVKALSDSKNEISGGESEWDELDDMDFEELLNTESIPIQENKNTQPQNKNLINGNHFSNLVLYKTDKAFDVREKVALITNIKPYKQYLWAPNERLSIDGDNISLMSHWTTSLRRIEGYPIDGYFKTDYKTQLSLKSFVHNSAVVFTCISIDSIIRNKSKLQFIARSDSESYELIYSNIIGRFYPAITIPIFNQYISDETLIDSKFEHCAFDPKEILKKYDKRATLISELNKQKQITINSSDLLTVTTTGMVMTSTYGDGISRVDTMNLFQSIDLTEINNIAYADLYCLDDDMRPIRLRKLQQRDRFRLTGDDHFLAFGKHTKKTLVSSRSIIFTLLSRSEFNAIKIVIDKFASIWIYTQPNQTLAFSKSGFIQFISPIIDSIIQIINSFDSSFLSHERFPLLKDPAGFKYQFPSSSSKLSFMFPVSYSKLLDLMIDKLLAAGFVESISNEYNRRGNGLTSFTISYGVTRVNASSQKYSSIDIRNVTGVAVVILSNLDVDETDLYVDIIGRMITLFKSDLIIKNTDKTQLSVVDPVLFRLKLTSDGYSRICQRKFQPVASTSDNKKAVEYYNFTFQRPEYYTCPSKDAPVLGFIQGKHEQGYCLPCCRKMPQPNHKEIKESCMTNESVKKSNISTYKIEYPIIEISNSKIMNRRISLPNYLTQLLGIQTAVANGTILASHGGIRDGIDPNTNSFLQTATIISAIETKNLQPLYESTREFILDIIGMIKEPSLQITIMKNKLICDRFITPQGLIHAIEDYFLRNKILDSNANLSAVEWNDLIIYLSNCMGLNVLLLADERIKGKGIQLINIHDVDVAKPALILLRRTNVEWSSRNHNTRAVYLPITTSSFKVLKISTFIVQKLNISKSLTKIKRITSGPEIKMMSNQLTIDRISEMSKHNKTYKLLDDKSDQKIAVVQIGKTCALTTVSTMSLTIKPQDIKISPTASFKDIAMFISDYNTYFMNEMPDLNESINSYKAYLSLALKTSNKYEFIQINAFLLKIHKFIICDTMVIGIIVNIVNINKVVATELMFIKPSSVKLVIAELKKFQIELTKLHSFVKPKAILCFPITTDVLLDPLPSSKALTSFDHAFIMWLNNPLKSYMIQPKNCKQDMKTAFNVGQYTSEIYNLFVSDIVRSWKQERSTKLDEFIIKALKKMGSLPIPQTKIDKLMDDIPTNFDHYDPVIVRSTIANLFEKINSVDKTITQAISALKNENVLIGFELKNIHRYNKSEIRSKVIDLMKDLTVKSSTYPSLDNTIPIKDQYMKFYDSKNKKLIIHSALYTDLIDMIVSDLSNPFRRDYIINLPLIESSFMDTLPHLGEIIYIQPIN